MIYLIPHTIERAADRNPDHEAVRFAGQALTYEELCLRANRLARSLHAVGARRRDRVGIFLSKSIESAVAMYGIMQAGASYVPLDPAAPIDRLADVIRDCQIRHVVTQDSKIDRVRQLARSSCGLQAVIGISESVEGSLQCISWKDVARQSGGSPPDVGTIEQDLAYIIYTSGSTGTSKGIMHTHHSGLSFAQWAANEYGLHRQDRLSNHSPLHFDMSIFDFFAGAFAGATTVMIPESHTKLAASYSQLLADEKITTLFTVPFALIQLLTRGMLESRDLSALRWVIFGGEPFSTKHVRSLMEKLPAARFDNMYGPAETNGCTHYTVTNLPNDCEQVPIGRVNEISEAMLVDDDDQPVAIGETGELLIRGPSVMQGYWGRPDLNARAFMRRKMAADYEDVFYRTGDLVRAEADGNLSVLGA